MKFSDVVGQRDTCKRLLAEVKSGRIAHAQLFCGPEGSGKFAIALAYACYLLCEHPVDDDSCGECASCVKTNILEHPDLHFVFPTIKKKTCDSLYKEWEDMVKASPYFTLDTWLTAMGAANEQAMIYASESDTLIQKLMVHSSEGGRKVVIIWLPERMNEVVANKMLKFFEEPPSGTVILLVSEAPEMLLPTVVSRMQRFDVPPVAEADVKEALMERNHVEPVAAARIARLVRGNFTEAQNMLLAGRDEQMFFDEFVILMRKAYAKDLKGLLEWSNQVGDWGRERIRNFFTYSLRLVRENFVYNFGIPKLNYMSERESKFATRFARFINERNVIGIADEMERVYNDVLQNGNAKIALFDFSMKMIILIHR